MKERGVLGKWGPNHAADPIVTRWKRDAKGKVLNNTKTGKPILQFVSIQRKDTNEWAIPGGMVDPGEQVSVTVRREFMEEALDSTTASEEKKKEMEAMVGAFFSKGDEIYSGYVDDPRNTDNAWMETVAFLFHDEEGTEIGKFDLKAGDDAQALKWTDISADMKLYASHAEFVQKATQKKNAHW
jgi:ADP-ribose pyrophosphatase